jgi:hypothetical protein
VQDTGPLAAGTRTENVEKFEGIRRRDGSTELQTRLVVARKPYKFVAIAMADLSHAGVRH